MDGERGCGEADEEQEREVGGGLGNVKGEWWETG